MVMEDRGSSLGEARLEDQVDYFSVFLTRWRVKEHGELFFYGWPLSDGSFAGHVG